MERTDFEQWKAREVARLLALVETERRYYQEMVASLPAPVVVLSGAFSVVYANRAFRRHFGLHGEELRRTTVSQIFPGAGVEEKIREAHASGAPAEPIAVHILGRRHRVSLVPIRNWDDETELETLLLVEDLTAPPEALKPETLKKDTPNQETSREEPEAVQDVGTEIPGVVWHADASTLEFKATGGAVEQLLGYPSAHWLANPRFFEDRIHPDDAAAVMGLYRSTIAQGGEASAEFRVLTFSGSVVWCRESIRVPVPSAPAPRLMAGVLINITRRKELEQQTLRSGRNEALQTVAGRLAHDLNNPLMIATGYAEELVSALAPGTPPHADAEHVLDATGRLANTTRHLNAFTRRSAKPARRVDLGALFAEIEPSIAKVAGVPLEIAASPNPVHAAADAEQLTDVILALASSARDGAADRTRLAIEWDADLLAEQIASSTLTPGRYARILLRDDGRGLARGAEYALFETVVESRESSPVASALARAYAIVREWGGDLAVSSMVGQGTTLALYIPYLEPPVLAVPEQVEEPVPVELEPAPPPEPLRETILVVDDEAGIRGLVRKILKREHYQVLEAGSAEDALTIAVSRAAPIDLLLTDVVLPGLSGPDLARRMCEASPNLRVLYISGYMDDPAVKAGEYPPGAQFLAKPFTLSALLRSVRETLDAS